MMNEFDLTVFRVETEDAPRRARRGVVSSTIKMLALGIGLVFGWHLAVTDWGEAQMRRRLELISGDPLAFALADGVTDQMSQTVHGESPDTGVAAQAVFVPARHIPELRGMVCQRLASGEVFIHQYRAGARLHPEERREVTTGAEKEFCDTAFEAAG